MNDQANKPQKRKRRWFQYSLRTMLLVVTVVGVWLGFLVNRVNKQKAAAAWVRENGGIVLYDFEWDADKKTPLDDPEPPGPAWLRDMIGIDYFADVVAVNLMVSEVSDLDPLSGLTSLQKLDLFDTAVSDLTPLSGLTSLETLYLEDTAVSDLTPLSGLASLKELYLSDSAVSDLTPLSGLDGLQFLDLRGTAVSDLTPLVGLKNVTIHLDCDHQVQVPTELEGRIVPF